MSDRRIDHIVISSNHRAAFSQARVLNDWDLSDHYPVMADCSPNRTPGRRPTTRERSRGTTKIDVKKGDSQVVRDSNYWSILRDSIDEAAIEDMDEDERKAEINNIAETFVQTSRRLAKEAGMEKKHGAQNEMPLVNNVLAFRIRQRRTLHRLISQASVGGTEWVNLQEQYIAKAQEVKRLTRTLRRRRWAKNLATASKAMRESPREYWRWASSLGGWRRKESSAGLQPVKDPSTGEILMELDAISRAWATHYGELASDVSGHSRNPAAWEHLRCDAPRDTMETLNRLVSKEELEEALKKMKNHKAPGGDGLPTEFLKIALEAGAMQNTLLKVINLQFRFASIPKVWQSSVVVSIPKKGDLTDMNNHRGISLMAVVVKVLTTIISQRLNEVFEGLDLFSPAQAGFRTLEECVTQVACLYEIGKRRTIAGEGTYLLFVDFKKAYDTVPHEALFVKLENYGVRGRMLDYIRAIYRDSVIQVRTGGPNGVLSEPVPLLRGLRQGCPMSPVLFNIFINNIFDNTENLGVQVPAGVPNSPNPWLSEKVSGLLFADDLVAIAPTRRRLKRMCDHLGQWARAHELEVGIQKCGVMAINRPRSMLEEKRRYWKINGEEVPIVDQYQYLGIQFRSDLDIPSMVQARFEASDRTVKSLAAFLRCYTIPLHMRISVVKAVVMPRLLYGADIYGMNKKLTDKVQGYLNKALRLIAGANDKAPVASVALWREIGIPPICASAAARRARAYLKCASLKSHIRELVALPYRCRGWTWVTGTTRWLNRYLKDEDGEKMDWVGGDPKVVKKWVTNLVQEREERIRLCATSVAYIDAAYDKCRVFSSSRGVAAEKVQKGLQQIVLLRLGAFWTCKKLALCKLIPSEFERQCPMCDEPESEDIAHMLLRCAAWAEARDRHLGPVLDSIRQSNFEGDVDAGFTDSQTVTLLLGGEVVRNRLMGWCFTPEMESSDDQESEENSVDGGHYSPVTEGCVSLRLARFLTTVAQERSSVIRTLRPAQSQQQGPFTALSQSPNG